MYDVLYPFIKGNGGVMLKLLPAELKLTVSTTDARLSSDR